MKGAVVAWRFKKGSLKEKNRGSLKKAFKKRVKLTQFFRAAGRGNPNPASQDESQRGKELAARVEQRARVLWGKGVRKVKGTKPEGSWGRKCCRVDTYRQ